MVAVVALEIARRVDAGRPRVLGEGARPAASAARVRRGVVGADGATRVKARPARDATDSGSTRRRPRRSRTRRAARATAGDVVVRGAGLSALVEVRRAGAGVGANEIAALVGARVARVTLAAEEPARSARRLVVAGLTDSGRRAAAVGTRRRVAGRLLFRTPGEQEGDQHQNRNRAHERRPFHREVGPASSRERAAYVASKRDGVTCSGWPCRPSAARGRGASSPSTRAS